MNFKRLRWVVSLPEHATAVSGAKRTFREVRQIIERALVSSFHPLLYALPFDLLKQGLVA